MADTPKHWAEYLEWCKQEEQRRLIEYERRELKIETDWQAKPWWRRWLLGMFDPRPFEGMELALSIYNQKVIPSIEDYYNWDVRIRSNK